MTTARRWFSLFLGVFLIQGSLAFSPIPDTEVDQERIQYNEFLRDDNYRLPTNTRPTRYVVTLEPYFTDPPPGASQFTFDGEVAIIIQATEDDVNEIVLHCNDLTIVELSVHAATNLTDPLTVEGQTYECHENNSFLRIPLISALSPDLQYVITSKFVGNLQTNMRGFYRSWYIDDSGERRWMATTQFQPGHARQAFPCYDEPGFKARFDITIIRPSDFSPTLSNMPIKETTHLTENREADEFFTTPLTSTYLLAFIVSHYRLVASSTNEEMPFNIYARNNIGETGQWSLDVGKDLLVAMENYTDFPYYSMADNLIMQQAAIPDFSAGAMENWGLLTYREALILYDPVNSNHFYRQRVANIVSHEIAHMWFGNLVTCAWWDNLWLNEGFARFYQYFLTARVASDMGYEVRFIVEQEHTALLDDSFDNAHALTNPVVSDPASVSRHFSTITYAKGAAVLRMTQYLMGQETYEKALRKYLHDNQFSVAEPQDLFDALDAVADEDNVLAAYGGITIEEYMKTWTEKPGHPLLTVAVDHNTGRISITQARWNINSGGVSQFSGLWHVPITWTRAGAIDFDDLKPTQIITGTTTSIDRGSIGREWVILNKQQSGFYRVNYDPVTWALITQALRVTETRVSIHEFNRAQIVDDVFILARAGVLSYSRAFNILSFLEFEDQYAPWIAAIAGFNFARRRLAHNPEKLEELKDNVIIKWSAAVTARLGFAEVEGESYMDGLLRMYVNTFLCNIGHEECIEAGQTYFTNWKNDEEFHIPPNMRPWVYCTGLRYGSASDFDVFWSRYLAEDLASEQVVMLTAAGCTTDEGSLWKFLNALTAGDEDYDIRAQDYGTARSSAITSNEVNTLRAFNWLKENDNLERSTNAFGTIGATITSITSRLLTEEQISEVSTWLVENRSRFTESDYNEGINGIATARNNIRWYGERIAEFDSYFETGYIEDTFEDDLTTPPTTTPAPTTPGTSTTPGGSATALAFSVVTLLVTLVINLGLL